MNQTPPRSRRGLSAENGTPRHEQPIDDWLGEVSDDDWSEQAAERSERRRTTPEDQGGSAPAVGPGEPVAHAAAPTRPADAAQARRAAIERRRLVAGLVVAAALGLAVVIPVVLLRGGGGEPLTSVAEPPTTPAPSETSRSSTPSPPPPSASPTTTTPTTQGFVLPEGTKLERGDEGDSAVIRELQQALVEAGYDPGPADGTFGARTEAAVVAFQQDNGLAVDGRVGPETAAALNSAIASG
jgi:hypothetical protein